MTYALMALCLVAQVLISYFLGSLFTDKTAGSPDAGEDIVSPIDSVFRQIVTGFFVLMSIFEILTIPCIFLKKSLTFLSGLICAVTVIALVVSLVLYIKRGLYANLAFALRSAFSPGRRLIFVAAVLIVCFQGGLLGVGIHMDDDDAFYVASSTVAVDTDSLYHYDAYTGEELSSLPSRYVLSPFSMYAAVCSKLFHVRPVVFAHTLLPFFMIPLSYIVYWLFGSILFKSDVKRTSWFIVVLSLLNVFSMYSTYSADARMLIRIWQGKAILAVLVMIYLLYFNMRVFHRDELSLIEFLELVSVMLCGCFVSSMGIVLTAVELAALALTYLIKRRRIKPALTRLVACVPNLVLAIIFLLIR